MFVSKFWILLLALVMALVAAIALLAKDVVNRERNEAGTAMLYKELTKVDVALNLHARKRLDVLLAPAADPDLGLMLLQASKGKEKAAKSREELLNLLRNHNKDLGKYKADMLLVLDNMGTVVAQVGKNERQFGYKLGGFPMVEAALRGYIRDDIWKLGNDVYLMAARPVVVQRRYAGAIVHGMKLTDSMVNEISPQVQMAFYAGQVMIAVGTPQTPDTPKLQGPFIAQPLEEVVKSDQYKKKGYSEVQLIHTEEGEFKGVFSKVQGEAALNGVGFALVTPVEVMNAFTEFYEKAGSQDVEALPYFWLISGVLLLTGLGWGWTYLEGQRPVSRLLKHLESLEKSDPKDQLNIYRFRRKVRQVALAFNRLMDYKIKSFLESAEVRSQSIDSILGKAGQSGRVSSASFKFVEADANDIPAPPPAGPSGNTPPSILKKSVPASNPVPVPAAAPAAPPTPAAALASPGSPPAPPAPPAPPGAKGAKPPAPPAAVAAAASSGATARSPQEEIAYFKEVYTQFTELKKKLGDSVDQLTFERFQETLKKNRDALVARYGCKRVNFRVYEKEGKASLKATPVKA